MSTMPSVTLTRVFGAEAKEPSISVVIVAYNTDELEEGLSALAHQRFRDFETVVVDNGAEDLEMLSRYQLRYFKLDRNHGLSAARNFAAAHARGRILAFLDDDAIPDACWTEVVQEAFEDSEIAGIRGRATPRTHNVYNHLALHYDLGPVVCPAVLDSEANIAVRAETFRSVGGFDPSLFGREGIDLTKRLVQYGSVQYHPEMVICHDYADSLGHYLRKQYRHAVRRHTEVLSGTFEPGPPMPQNNASAVSQPGTLTRILIACIRRLGDYADLAGILSVRVAARRGRL